MFRDRIEPHWFGDQTRFWYHLDLAQGPRQFVVVDVVVAGLAAVTQGW